jgi:hypothetical protein
VGERGRRVEEKRGELLKGTPSSVVVLSSSFPGEAFK